MLLRKVVFLSLILASIPHSLPGLIKRRGNGNYTPKISSPISSPVIIPHMQLDEAKIETYKKKLKKDFTLRSYLAKTTYIGTAATLAWIGYKFGLFNFILPNKAASVPAPVGLPEIGNFSHDQTHELLAKVLAYLKSNAASTNERLSAVEIKHDIPKGNWFVNTITYIGWTGFSIAGTILLNTKLQNFFEYALATPSFKWLFSNITIMSTLDGLKKNMLIISDKKMIAELAKMQEMIELPASDEDNTSYRLTTAQIVEHNKEAITPAMQSLARNLEEFVGFTEYYMGQIDSQIIADQAMGTTARYLYNLSNDFFTKIHTAASNSDFESVITAINEFKSDVAQITDRCRLFEKEFLE